MKERQYEGEAGQYEGECGQYKGEGGQYEGEGGQYEGEGGQYEGEGGQYEEGIDSASLCPGGPVPEPYSSSVPSPFRLF